MTQRHKENKWNPVFKDLFILDMANNHQGSFKHGLDIIREVAELAKKNNAKVAIKFQYRDLDTFIHSDFVNDKQNKHIGRFLSTRLKPEEFKTLVEEAKKLGLLTMCTPFDEKSVDLIEKHNIDIIKIASCSSKDKLLLQRISKSTKPIVCSLAGADIKDIDYAVYLFEKSGKDFALMHCVAIYPTPLEKLGLNTIDFLKERYDVPIGFSTHEDPNDTTAVKLAVAKGVWLLERHVGKETNDIKLNAYSSTAEQIDKWIKAAQEARRYCGGAGKSESTKEEIDSLRSLGRGVYLTRDVKKGEKISKEDVFFAMPLQEGQIISGEFVDGMVASDDYAKNSALKVIQKAEMSPEEIIVHSIQQAKSMLRSAKIEIGNDYEVELSHHYGIEKFPQVGLVLVKCMDRDYCKKLLIQLPGQSHPEHSHKTKEESFQLLYGVLDVVIDGLKRTLYPGNILLIEPGQAHSFSTKTGAIVEEVSTKYAKGGSVYADNSIFSSNPDTRKTYLEKL